MCEACLSVGKFCSRCDTYKHFVEFPRGTNRGGTEAYCLVCRPVYKREYYQRKGKAERTRLRERRDNLKRKYGLTEDEYLAMFQAQDGKCACCRCKENTIDHRTEHPRKLAVDHCHTTGKIRALLCNACNMSLGLLEESPERMRALLLYTERLKEQS